METMTVLALMGIMTALAASSLEPLRARVLDRQGAELVDQLLVAARQRAMSSGRCFRVELLDAANNPVHPTDPGPAVALRLRRFASASCELLTTPLDSNFDGSERFALPQGVQAMPVSPTDIDWLPSGRPRGSVRVNVVYTLRQLAVEATGAGLTCIHDTATGVCP
jgi:type II secretory pathway pseudopilin PulG